MYAVGEIEVFKFQPTVSLKPYVFTITSMGFERSMLIWSDLNKSLDSINQFDIESIRNCLISSKTYEPKICGQEEPFWRGHSNTSKKETAIVHRSPEGAAA